MRRFKKSAKAQKTFLFFLKNRKNKLKKIKSLKSPKMDVHKWNFVFSFPPWNLKSGPGKKPMPAIWTVLNSFDHGSGQFERFWTVWTVLVSLDRPNWSSSRFWSVWTRFRTDWTINRKVKKSIIQGSRTDWTINQKVKDSIGKWVINQSTTELIANVINLYWTFGLQRDNYWTFSPQRDNKSVFKGIIIGPSVLREIILLDFGPLR